MMAYEYEDWEWRAAMGQLTETERAAIDVELRRAEGVCGDRGDARYE